MIERKITIDGVPTRCFALTAETSAAILAGKYNPKVDRDMKRVPMALIGAKQLQTDENGFLSFVRH